jgi:hypothetical protein
MKKRRVRFQKPTFKDRMATVGRFFIFCLIAPFWYGWKFINWFYTIFLTEVYESGDNGIFGPGFHSWEHSRFSWGKASFLLLIILGILFFIFK